MTGSYSVTIAAPSADAPLRAALPSKPIACSSAYAALEQPILAERRPRQLEARPAGRRSVPTGSRSPGSRRAASAPCRSRSGTSTADRRSSRRARTRRPGTGRRDDEVEALERGPEVLGDLRAHLLRGPVVRVVVAARQRVGPEHDPPLDLGAEPRRAGAAVHRDQVARRRRPAGRSGRRRTARGWPRPRPARSGSRPTARAARAAAGTARPVAPSLSASLSVASKLSRTPGSIPPPSPVSSSGTPRRIPLRSSPRGSAIASGNAQRGRVAGVLADHVPEAAARRR